MKIWTMILSLCCIGCLVGGFIMLSNTPDTIELGFCYDDLNNKMVGLECEHDSLENYNFLFLMISGIVFEIVAGIAWLKEENE